MKRHLKQYSFLAGVAGLIVLFDQLTKYWVRTTIPAGESWSPYSWLEPYARIVHWYNTGAAFGMFQGMSIVFTILAIVVAIAIIYYYPRMAENDPLMRLALGMQLGGALGNLIDRITLGHVVDFISVGSFPVFNIADASITTGVGVLLLSLWLEERQLKKTKLTDTKHEESQSDGETIG